MSSITADLASVLSSIRRPGEFVASGKVELFAPKLDVDGVGRIALPLLPFQAADLIAFGKIDLGLSDRAANLILGSPKRYRLDGILVPALCCLVRSKTVKSLPVQRLLDACHEHLRIRIAEPLEALKDWRRASKLKCQCHHCSELSRFLDNSEHRCWAFRAAEAKRSHVTDTIRRSKSDVDVETDKRGRPYGLVCTKNQNSYDHKVRQRKQDLEDLASLEV